MGKKYKKYEGGELGENQYLLKIRPHDKFGFLSKINKTGKIPKLFSEWGNNRYNKDQDLPIYIYEETFNSGWKIVDFRGGESRDWAVMIHPQGFKLEIYAENFLEIILQNNLIKGEIIGEFKWEANKLIKK